MSTRTNHNWEAWQKYASIIGFDHSGFTPLAVALGSHLAYRIWPPVKKSPDPEPHIFNRNELYKILGCNRREQLTDALNQLQSAGLIFYDGSTGSPITKVKFRLITLLSAIKYGEQLKAKKKIKLTVVK